MKPNRVQTWLLSAAFVLGVFLGTAMQGGVPAAAESSKLPAARQAPPSARPGPREARPARD